MTDRFDRSELEIYGRTLVLMAAADVAGVSPDERGTITRMFVEIGLDEVGAERAWSAPRDEAAVATALKNLRDGSLRRALLKDLLLVAHADGTYCDRERALIGRLRPVLGLDEAFERRLEDWVRRGLEWQSEGLALCTEGGGAL